MNVASFCERSAEASSSGAALTSDLSEPCPCSASNNIEREREMRKERRKTRICGFETAHVAGALLSVQSVAWNTRKKRTNKHPGAKSREWEAGWGKGALLNDSVVCSPTTNDKGRLCFFFPLFLLTFFFVSALKDATFLASRSSQIGSFCHTATTFLFPGRGGPEKNMRWGGSHSR